MKNDVRVRYTNKVITDSFLGLLAEKPIQEVTVRAICERAGVNRSTFYRYYKDTYDLRDALVAELWDAFLQQVAMNPAQDLQWMLEGMFSAVKNNRIPYMTLLSQNSGIDFFSRMKENSYALYHSGFERRFPGLAESQRRRIFYFLTEGCLAVTVDWVRGGMKESPEEMAAFLAPIDGAVLNLKL